MMIFLSDILTVIFITHFFNQFIAKRKISCYMFFLLFLLAIMCTFLGNYNGINQIGKILSFITLYIYISFLFKGSLINKFVLFLVCYLTIGISESLSIVFFQLFNPSFSLNNIYTSNTYLVIIILTQFFAYFFSYIIQKICHTIKITNLPKSFYILFFPALTTILFLIVYGNYQTLFSGNKILVIILFLLLIFNFITILFQLQIIKNETLKKSLEISELSKEMMISKFNSLNKEYESNFKFLHSLLHTCAELNQLIDQKKYDELNLLIQSLSNKTIKEFNEIYTNSPIFSTVLNHKKNQLSSLNISVTSTLYSDDLSNLDSINQMIFFTKILDLAIKYCSLSDEQRFIIIKSRKDVYSCTLQIIFNFPSTFENDIKESTSNIDKEFNTQSDISFDYNLKIVDIIFLIN